MNRFRSLIGALSLAALVGVLAAASAQAQQTLPNQAEVDQALKDLANAEEMAEISDPGVPRIKQAEDALDAAARRNEDTPNEPADAKQNAQKAQDDAQFRADAVQGQSGLGNLYRDALRNRRAARKKLQEERAKIRRAAADARQQGRTADAQFLSGWMARLRQVIRRAEQPPRAPSQTGAPAPGIRPGEARRLGGILEDIRPTQPETPPSNVQMTIGAHVTHRDANVTVSRVAREVNNQKIHDVSTAQQNDTGAGGEIGLRVRLPESPLLPASFLQVTYNYFAVDGSTAGNTGQLDVLSFPGLGVRGSFNFSNPNGYFVLNAQHSFNYSYDVERHSFQARMGGEIWRGNFGVMPYVGVGFRHMTREDDFRADVPILNFPIQGQYSTRTTLESYSAFAGITAEWRFDNRYGLFLGGLMGLDCNRAESDVLFRITTPTFEDVQRVSISDRKVTPYFSVEGGVTARFGALQSRLSAFVEHGRYAPNVLIPGGGAFPSIDAERETAYGVTGQIRVPIF